MKLKIMKLKLTTLVFGDEDDMNIYHSLDQDPEPDLLNQIRVTEGDFTITNIHQLKDIFPIFHLETQELSVSLHIHSTAILDQNTKIH